MRPDIIRVLLVDDNTAVRNAVSIFLETYDDIEVVGDAGSGREAVAVCQRLHPDVALVDLVMPGMDGVATTRALHSQQPELVILLLTSSLDFDSIQRALDAGAVGYVPKTSGDEMVEAIYTALA